MLTDRITLLPPSSSSLSSTTTPALLEPEDYLSSALGVIFPDDITNQHGDPSTPVLYTSPRFGPILLSLPDPVGEGERRLFAQYLWNAGVAVAVGVEDAFIAGEGVAVSETGGGGRGARSGNGSGSGSGSGRGRGSASGRDDGESWCPKKDAWQVLDETVLELGAGTGIAGIVAVKAGAREVFLTDYPAEEVLANLRRNVERNLEAAGGERARCVVEGHEWGMVDGLGDSGKLRGLEGGVAGDAMEKREAKAEEGVALEGQEVVQVMDRDRGIEAGIDRGGFPASHAQYFSRILLADCLWMPSQHANLHRSIAYFLSPKGYAIVVAGFHTGRAKMAPFFDAEALSAVGLEVESIMERDAVGVERQWRTKELGDEGQGREDLSERKRWLVVAVLRRVRGKDSRDAT